MDISEIRKEYTQLGLRRDDLNSDPIQQFELWFTQAQQAELKEVNTMSLATAGADGMPQVRTVLLKLFDA